MFFCNSGSEANDSQMKLVWYMNNALGRPKKKKIISRVKAYHGVTIASASLTGLPNNHIDFDLPIARVLHTSCPHHYRFGKDGESEEEFATRLAAELEELILKEGPDTVAAFIAEPIMGAGGVIVPPKTYFPKIMAVCAKYDVFMIDDEVICGFGRLGTPFGCTALGYKPNSISVAKALSSAYLPIAGVMIPEDMYQALIVESRKIGVFGHGFTYSGHPVSAAVAVKTLEIYKRDKIFETAAARAPQFQKRLMALGDHPLVGEARGMGLVGAMELAAAATPRAVRPEERRRRGRGAQCEAEGLIVRVIAGDMISVCPPMIIKPAEIDELFDKLGRALEKTLDGRSASSCWRLEPDARRSATVRRGIDRSPAQKWSRHRPCGGSFGIIPARLLAQQAVFSRLDYGAFEWSRSKEPGTLNLDSWDGATAARERVSVAARQPCRQSGGPHRRCPYGHGFRRQGGLERARLALQCGGVPRTLHLVERRRPADRSEQ